METLGAPERAQVVVDELAALGVRVQVAGGAAVVNAVMEKLLAERDETTVDALLAPDAWRMVSALLGDTSVETTRSMYEGPSRLSFRASLARREWDLSVGHRPTINRSRCTARLTPPHHRIDVVETIVAPPPTRSGRPWWRVAKCRLLAGPPA